uniref:SphF n=1 Tax=Herpetosiphon sp. B060 TaxID=2002978 RepID=A0A2Z2HA22_9CHLR|nr:SphF [Herpetosiphon sp. B060]
MPILMITNYCICYTLSPMAKLAQAMLLIMNIPSMGRRISAMHRSKATIYQQVARGELSVGMALQALRELASLPAISNQSQQFALSEGQKALWMAYQLDPNQYAYNVPLAYILAPNTQPVLLEQALNDLIKRHPLLAARLVETDQGQIEQVWDGATTSISLERQQLSNVDWVQEVRQIAHQPFDLLKGPLFKATLFELPNRELLLLLNVHHIMFDGVSIQILLGELQAVYAAYAQGQSPQLAPLTTDFGDFVAWQQTMLASPNGQRQRRYWLEQLAGRVTPLELPYDRQPSGQPSFKGAMWEFELDTQLTAHIRSLGLEHNRSYFSLIMSGFSMLLARYGRQQSIYLGTPLSGRPEARFDNLIGYFMNMVVIGADLSDNPSYLELSRRIYETALDAMDHGDYPLFAIADELGGNMPFHAAFYFQNWVAPLAEQTNANATLLTKPVLSIHQEGEFSLTLEVIELGDRYSCYFKYNPDYFDQATIQGMAEHLIQLLGAAINQPEQPIHSLPSLLAAEQRLLTAWNQTQTTYPRELALPSLVAQQAAATPDAIAIIGSTLAKPNQTINYRTLMAAVDQIAAHLQSHGIGPGQRVAVLLNRSIEMVLSLLAIAKTGAAYIPLDPIYPAERLAAMLDDSQASLILLHGELAVHLPTTSIAQLEIEQLLAKQPAKPLVAVEIDPNSPVYLIYTSGSTGTPKGVVISHSGLTNFLWAMREQLVFSAKDRILAITTICFDIAGLELYLPLISGGSVEILPAEVTRDGYLLKQAIANSDATWLQATPATWTMLLAAEWEQPLQTILCGGERLSYDLAQQLVARASTVWNLYGPTETTIWSTASRIQANTPITIGQPISNTTLYILDQAMQAVPIGVAGELYIGGAGVALEYWQQPALTNARFIDYPDANQQISRIYKTGDLARFRPDGQLEHLGRLDEQVKVRGFRIELMEIETTLRRQPEVREAVVVQRAEASQQLIGFVMLEDPRIGVERPFNSEALRQALAQSLPEYMLPTKIIGLREFPLTLNQKIERKVLKSLPLATIINRYGYPQTNIEQPKQPVKTQPSAPLLAELAELASTIVAIAPNEIDPLLPFGNYGFDSIRFTQFSTLLRKRFSLPIMPNIFYLKPTLQELAQHLQSLLPQQPEPVNQQVIEQPTLTQPTTKANAAIAIIGIAGTLPQSRDLAEFWQHLVAGADLITPVPANREAWTTPASANLNATERQSINWGGFIPAVDTFDAAFFGISPREAALMDPQQRLMLETVWKAIEDAGYRASSLQAANVGVFIGASGADFLGMTEDSIDGYTLTGIARSVIANRISYLLNFHGPSEPVDTACSSSLVAVHRAAQAIRNGECELALAGGVNVMLSDFASAAASKVGMLSPDGRCKTFDASANGYVRGEGAAVILLKPLELALRDRDHIYAVIRGSAVNHGGRANSLTAPNPNAQSALIYQAYRNAGIDPASVGYIETHGTGTALGDPIEVDGLKSAFQKLYHDADQAWIDGHCALGSVKSNIGHLEAAAGIAGLIKTVLALKQRYIPATIHLQTLNPYIEVEASPFSISRFGRDWNTSGVRRAGVSSFGFGGSNAHIILEEAPVQSSSSVSDQPTLIVLSAKTATSLQLAAHQLATHIQRLQSDQPLWFGATSLRDLAYTLLTGREAFRERLAIVASDFAELAVALNAYLAGNSAANIYSNTSAQTAAEATMLHSLAQQWVAGATIEWSQLDTVNAPLPQRQPVPSYAFMPDHYPIARRNQAQAVLHPLVERNSSTFNTTQFSTRLLAEAFYLRDHIVQGQRVLPGVTYLEIARAAGSFAAEKPVQRISNLIWASPCVVEQVRELTISLQPQPNAAGFSITTQSATGSKITHAEGTLRYDRPDDQPNMAKIDLAPVRSRLTHQKTAAECYHLFAEHQFAYGPSFQVIEQIAYNADESLATIKLPAAQQSQFADFGLHPSLLDGALQTVILLLSDASDSESRLALPFAIGELVIFGQLAPECLVHAIRNQAKAGEKGLVKYTIQICTPDGQSLIQINDYTIRAMPNQASVQPASSNLSTIAYYTPQWEQVGIYETYEGV